VEADVAIFQQATVVRQTGARNFNCARTKSDSGDRKKWGSLVGQCSNVNRAQSRIFIQPSTGFSKFMAVYWL